MRIERGMIGRSVGWMAAIALLSGCCTSREQQLAAVAKDWCLSIRASQIIPVYPLTEDLQPGDVFLVQRTVLDQAEQYSSRGYLPLDQLVARLGGLNYARFYDDAYWKGDYKAVPHPRLEASTPIAGAQTAKKGGGAQGNGGNQGGGGGQGNGNGAKENDTDKSSVGTRFPNALVPRASFPSYDFETKRGAGVNLAVPVYGVPVGLSLMGTDQATGSITITDAFTYGIDIESLYARLKAWSRKNFSKELARIAQTTARPLYLRVVSRVYLTGAVTVALTNQASQSAGLDVGIAKEVTLEGQPPRQEESNSGGPKTPKPNPGGQEEKLQKSEEKNDGKTVQERYAAALGVINKALNEGGPGGSLRVAAASRRSVTLREDFVHPLVIGYLGFDVQIMEDGEIGPLIATLDVLDHKVNPDVPPSKAGTRSRTLTIAEYSSMFARIKEASAGSPKLVDLIKRLDELKAFVPPKHPTDLWEETDQGVLTKGKAKDADTSKTEDFRRLTTYAGQLNESIIVLKKHEAQLTDAQRADRKQTEEELERIQGILNFHPAVNELVILNASMK